MSDHLDKSVTVVVRRTVKPDRSQDYEEWLNRLTAEVASTQHGYLGAEFQKPAAGSKQYTSVFSLRIGRKPGAIRAI